MKSFADICKEADANSKDMKKLTELWEYVRVRNGCYSDSHREFIREHLNKYAKLIREEERRSSIRKHYESD